MATIVLPLDLDHTCGRPKGEPRWYNEDHNLVYGVRLTEERDCPACAYLRGYQDGKENDG